LLKKLASINILHFDICGGIFGLG